MEIESTNFIESIINEDLATGKHTDIVTRFPPEPNGYLHVGHAKSLSINFGVKEKYNGECNLRYDDTNPTKEDIEYVESIKRDIAWLGHTWDRELYASDYFEQMYEHAVGLIEDGKAFVCDMSADEISLSRGTLTAPGTESPYRNRSIKENLELFKGMRAGAFADGEKVLRAKIDMASPNINMRDPIIYRILRAHHHRTGDEWCIYPMYDFAHPISDAIEGITHSLCTLEFEDHRPLYDWVKLNCGYNPGPRQIEFARLNLTRTIMSKRYLKKLVDDGVVDGWDDPRMPTISGMRERGYPPEAIKDFCSRIGVAKSNSEVDAALLEYCVREYLNLRATRVMVVKNPIKLIIDNCEGSEEVDIDNNPMDDSAGKRKVSFSDTLYIEREDFNENPPSNYFRLKPGGMVRLKGAYIVKYVSHGKDAEGNTEVHCELIKDSKSGGINAKIKVKSTIHWADASTAVDVRVNDYDYLLDDSDDGRDFSERLNPDSKKIITGAKAEAMLKDSTPYTHYQFMRCGYYMTAGGSTSNDIVFNMVVGLKDSYRPN